MTGNSIYLDAFIFHQLGVYTRTDEQMHCVVGYLLCQGEGCGLQWVWLRGVVYSGQFDWLLGGIVAAVEMRMRSVWVEVESCLENICLVKQ